MPVFIPRGRDMTLSPESVWEMLKKADGNNDGRVSRQELKNVMEQLGSRMPRFRALMFLFFADIEDGHITCDAKIDVLVDLILKCFDEEILHVFGSLMENHTGSIQWLKMNLEDASHSGRSAKRKRDIKGESEIVEQDNTIGKTVSLDIFHKMKKSKKEKTREES